MNQPITISVTDACHVLGIGRTLLFALLRDNRLTRCKVGRRTLITVASINELVAQSADVVEH